MLVNNNTCFVEGVVNNLVNTLQDDATPSDMLYSRIRNKKNVVKENKLYVEIKPDVLSSTNYKSDKNIIEEGRYFPFEEGSTKSYNVISNNPIIFKSNIGDNNSEDFDDLFTLPFEDRENFNKDRTISSYRFYVNAYSTQKLSQSISVLGTFEELSGKRIIESSLRGISAYLPIQDARNRNVSIVDYYDPLTDNLSESFLDEEIENNINRTGLIKRQFKYENVTVNGMLYTILVTDGNTNSFVPKLTSKVLYYNEENNNISPFDDNVTEEDITGNIVTTSRGTDSDLSLSTTSTIGFSGEID